VRAEEAATEAAKVVAGVGAEMTALAVTALAVKVEGLARAAKAKGVMVVAVVAV